MNFIEQFQAARRVSTPLLCIRSFDAKTTIASITSALNGDVDSTALITWDAIKGLAPINKSQKTLDTYTKIIGDSGQAMSEVITNALRMCDIDEIDDTIIFITNAHLQWKTDPAVVQAIYNLRDPYKANGNMLILVSLPGAILPPELTSDVLVLDEPLPTAEELQKTVRDTFEFGNVPEGSLADETLKAATSALIGLPAFPAEQSTAMCLELQRNDKKDAKKVTGGKLNIYDLWQRKREIINQAPGLSVYEGKETLDDIGGVQSAKDFLRAVMEGNHPPEVIIFIDEIEKGLAGTGTDMSGTKTELTGSLLKWFQDRNIDGIMSIGIPGVSKSALSKAVGGSYGKPVINFDVAGMQGSLVGESGNNLRTSQKVVDAIAGGGSILAIATCNGIASLPPEMRRRFSLAQFFFDAPSEEEKEIIWKIHRAKQHIPEDQPNPKAAGWTGAEIESCCKKAYMLNWTLEKAAGYIVPVTTSAPEKIKQIRMEASGKYLSASKPGVYLHTETETPARNISGPSYNDGRKMRS